MPPIKGQPYALRGNAYFKKECGLDKFWPDHVSDRFRLFPTVSFFLNDLLDHFHLWKADPVQTRVNHDA